MKRAFLIQAVISIILFSGSTAGASTGDRITVRTPDGHTQQFFGRIIEETYRNIRMEVDDREREIPLVREGRRFVTEVRHRRYPPVYTRADSLRRDRQFHQAFERYRESVEAQEVSEFPWIAPYLRYYAGEAAYMEAVYARWEDEEQKQWLSDAAARFDRLLQETPEHRLAPDAALGLARSLTRLGEFERARTAFANIDASDYPFWIKDEARVWQGRLAAAEGSYQQAVDMLGALWEEYRESNPELAYRAKLFEAFAWEGKDSAERAENLFQEVGLQSPDSEMRAVAWSRRGLSLFARGQQREALLSFLRVAIMHPDIRHETQRALYYAARASEEYYGSDERAAELREKLRVRFPGSYWAERAQ